MTIQQYLQDRFFGLRWPVIRTLLRHGLIRKLANYVLSELQLKLGLRWLATRPYWLVFDPNSGCDLHCPFCPTGRGKGTRSRTQLSWEHYTRMMDALGPYLLHIEFSNWGEPMLNPKIFDMVRYAKGFGVEVHFSSHFNHFSEEAAEKLIDSGLDWLVLSIDGASPETYAQYRVGGDFTKVLKNVETLIAAKRRRGTHKPLLMWQFFVFRHNEHEIETAREMASRLGVDEFAPSPAVIPNPEWVPQGPGAYLYPERETEKVQALLSGNELRDNRRKKLPLCVWPWIGTAINSNGSVSPCCGIEDEVDDYGNAFEASFASLWNGRDYREGRRFVVTREDNGFKNACTTCPVIGKVNMHIPRTWRTGEWGGVDLEESLLPVPFPSE